MPNYSARVEYFHTFKFHPQNLVLSFKMPVLNYWT